MPTYVYRRPDGTTFERFQKISEDALTEDPETGVPVKRVISGGAGLQFKGDGFYITDYVKKSGSADAGDAPPKKESTSETKEKPAKTPAKSTESKAASTSASSSDS